MKKRNGSLATEQDVPSVECAKDGIAFDQKYPEVLRFSPSIKRIANEASANVLRNFLL
ncbi:MAG: hypothetical protein Q8911_04290 [Bacillota bacterium]|nr:hypothetical protein [Bacillota bacterium]